MKTEQMSDEPTLDEFVRLDGVIRDCEHVLHSMERFKARGFAIPSDEQEEVRRKLGRAISERDQLDALFLQTIERKTNP